MTTTNILATQELSYLSNLSASEGYQVLSKNLPKAVTNFENTPQAQSAIQKFESGVAQTKTVSAFVNNPQLVDFVLSAFGLDSEDSYQGLIKDVLTQDPNSPSSLVNQLTDPRFKQLATALDFFSDGLSQLQAIGEGHPTKATSAAGVTLPSSSTSASSSSSTPVSVGLGVTGNEYLVLQNSKGQTVYTQSAYFTLNSQNELETSDGSTLYDGVSLPTGTTAVTVTGAGEIYAQVKGSSTPQQVGELEVATFKNPSALGKNAAGYLTPTSASGAANDTFVQNNGAYAFANTMQGLVNDYVTNEFDVAVGDNNNAVREALYFQQNISTDEKQEGKTTQDQADVVLGNSVFDNVAEVALGQPAQIAYEQLSSQENIIENGVKLTELQNPTYVAQFTKQYLAMYDSKNPAGSSSSTVSSPALQILSAFGGSSSSSSSSTASSILSLLT